MNTNVSVESLKHKVWEGGRIDSAEALQLYHLPLIELGQLADRRRQLAKAADYEGRGNEIVTFSVDRNINYTNICCVGCRFCAFYRTETQADAYVLSREDLDKKIEETLAQGGTQILLQGGHHPHLSLDWHLDLISHIKRKFPAINIHGFSPSEAVHFQRLSGLSMEIILRRLMAAGLGSLPGGGAEILVDAVRRQISPRKATSAEWCDVMRVAHRLGLRSSATMMFGHVETLADRLEHLSLLRQLQDETHGFTAFIGWTFQAENTQLPVNTAGAHEYLRMQALARIFLDNIANIQSSWVTQGPDIGQIALKFGANDLGSIMIEENVVAKAGASYRMDTGDMHRLIRDLGYEPRQRDFWYRLVPLAGLAAC